MATQEDFKIMSKKDLEKVGEALTKAKETIDLAFELLGTAPVKKTRKPRESKDGTDTETTTVATEATTPTPLDIKKDTAKAEKAAPVKVAPKAMGKSPVPPKKANGSFAPSIPKH